MPANMCGTGMEEGAKSILPALSQPAPHPTSPSLSPRSLPLYLYNA